MALLRHMQINLLIKFEINGFNEIDAIVLGFFHLSFFSGCIF